jgi:transposase
MNNPTSLAETLLGLDGFQILEVHETSDELIINIETKSTVVGCPVCGVRAQAKDRMRVDIRDLPCFGRPARLVWMKRRWRCSDSDCDAKTWTETTDHVPPRGLLTNRAGIEAARQVGELARPVASVAKELGVCWWTVMDAVKLHGTPLVDDPNRVGVVNALGIDETSFLKSTKEHPTLYTTGLVDLNHRIMIDMVEGNSATSLRSWCKNADPEWLGEIKVVATDLAESYRAGLSPYLDHAIRVADPFHVVQVANRTLDKVRRRVQNEILGHRGRKSDPLFKIRKLLLAGAERLNESGNERLLLGLRIGDPDNEVHGAWLAKESVRDIYLTDDPREAEVLLDKAITGCLEDKVAEIRSLGRTLQRWRNEILNHHLTGASNGPTEGLNLCVKKVKRCGHGFKSFENYRLRVLLYTGGVSWPKRSSPPRIRTHNPHLNA